MIPDVVGAKEACELLNINTARLRAIRSAPSRRRIPFPEARELATGPVWDRAEVLAWDIDRKEGRALELLRAYRSSGAVDTAARQAGVAPTTARRWLDRMEAR